MKRLFLDDIRHPSVCLGYMQSRVGQDVAEYKHDWVIVRNYKEFVNYLETEGLPDLVSFDHDLAEIHYNSALAQEVFQYEEETGADCARYLNSFCIESNLPIPKYFVHSMNPVGAENIKHILK